MTRRVDDALPVRTAVRVHQHRQPPRARHVPGREQHGRRVAERCRPVASARSASSGEVSATDASCPAALAAGDDGGRDVQGGGQLLADDDRSACAAPVATPAGSLSRSTPPRS